MRKTPMPPRKHRIRQVSARKRAQEPARKACLKLVRERAHGYCEAMLYSPDCKLYGSEGHEKLRRSQGGDPTNAENVLWVCSECHREIHKRPENAYANGLLVRRAAS